MIGMFAGRGDVVLFALTMFLLGLYIGYRVTKWIYHKSVK
jgi:hypothetical protein